MNEMDKETMRKRLMEMETRLKEQRPHDGFTLRMGIPENGAFSVVGSSPMIQTTLNDFADWDREAIAPPPFRVYDFHITVHPAMLNLTGGEFDRTYDSLLILLTTNYPRHSE